MNPPLRAVRSRWTLVLGLALPLVSSRLLVGQTVADSIRRLDSAWARAYALHDTTLAQALLAEDLVVTSANGSIKDKQAELGDIRPQAGLQMQYFRTSNVEVRVHGAAAVVIGIAEWAFTFNGTPSTMRRRYTAMFVRGGPLGWRIVALHIGRAPEPAGG